MMTTWLKICSIDIASPPSVKHPDDKKKIYYSLTSNGKKVAKVHDQMHETIKTKLVDKLTAKYSIDDLKIVANFLDDLYQLEQKF